MLLCIYFLLLLPLMLCAVLCKPCRVKSTQIAMEKAGDDIKGAVLASDAFFPFSWGDSVEMACQVRYNMLHDCHSAVGQQCGQIQKMAACQQVRVCCAAKVVCFLLAAVAGELLACIQLPAPRHRLLFLCAYSPSHHHMLTE